MLKTSAAQPVTAPASKIRVLAGLRGIGPESATLLTREVFYRSFANRRALASYVGLSPSPFRSGDSHREQGISKAGNPRARTAMIELGWRWLLHQPRSALSLWFHKRAGAVRGGRTRRIAIVALARKLLVALWRLIETGLIPTGAELKSA